LQCDLFQRETRVVKTYGYFHVSPRWSSRHERSECRIENTMFD
jgi:hypothetical protein